MEMSWSTSSRSQQPQQALPQWLLYWHRWNMSLLTQLLGSLAQF